MKNVEFFKLISLDEIMLKNPDIKPDPEGLKEAFGGSSIDGHAWIINDEMAPKFGNGMTYKFELIGDQDKDYTHYCISDGYYYHKDWFEPADTSKEEKIVIATEPAFIGVEDLEIPGV